MRPYRRLLAILLVPFLVLAACDFEQEVARDDPALWLRFGEAAPPFADTADDSRVATVAGADPGLLTTGAPSNLPGGDGVGVAKTAAGDAHLVVDDLAAGELAAAGGVTVEVWYAAADVVGTREIASRTDGTTTDWTLSQVDDEYRWDVFDDTGALTWSATGGQVTPGVTQQITGVLDASGADPQARLHVNHATVATSGAVAGDLVDDAGLDLRAAAGGSFGVLDDLIVFDEALSADAIGLHFSAGTSADPCDVVVGAPQPVAVPEVVVDTAADIGAPSLSPGVPITFTSGGFDGIDPAAIDAVQLEVETASGGAAIHAWPTGWSRPADPIIPSATPGSPSTIAVHTGDEGAVNLESSQAVDLTVTITGFWTGGELRATDPTVALDGTVDADTETAVTTSPAVPTKVTAALLAVHVDPAGAGTLSVPDPAEPDLGGRATLDYAAAPATYTTLARVDDGATDLTLSTDASVEVQILGWVTNPGCVEADTGLPTIAIDTPTDAAEIDADQFTFEMAGTAGDALTGVADIEFAVDGVVAPDLEADLAGEPGTWTVEHSVPAGTHTLTATAIDFKGNRSSDEVTVEVSIPGETEVVVDPVVYELDAVLEAALVSFDPNTGIMILDDIPGVREVIEPGTILVADPILPAAPEGLFHEVVQMRLVDGQWELQVVGAAFVDAFRQLDVSATVFDPGEELPEGVSGIQALGRSFGIEEWCKESSGPTEFCASLNGRIELGFDFKLKIDWGTLGFGAHIDHFRAVPTADLTADATLEASVGTSWSPQPRLLKEFVLPKIPIWGPVHVQPEIDINLVMSASAEAAITLTMADAGLHFEAGAEYLDGELSPVFGSDVSDPVLGFPDGGLTAEAGLEMSIAPRVDFELLVNGVVGPQLWVEPIGLAAEASISTSPDPFDPMNDLTKVVFTADLQGRFGIDLTAELNIGPLAWNWEIEGLEGDLYSISLVDIQIDLVRGCEVGGCGHKVLPPPEGIEEATVGDISDNGQAVGSWWTFDPVTGDGDAAPLWWDATDEEPEPVELPIDTWPSGRATVVSPDGSWALGQLSSLNDESGARWSLGETVTGPAVPGAPAAGAGWWFGCSINNNGAAVGRAEDGRLIYWADNGAVVRLEVIDPVGDQVVDNWCGGVVLADGSVVLNGRLPDDWTIHVFHWVPGVGLTDLGPGVMRDAVGSTVAGYTVATDPEDGEYYSAAVWDLGDPGAGPELLHGGGSIDQQSVAEGIDGAGNVFGVLNDDGEVRNVKWDLTDDGFVEIVLPAQMNIMDVTPGGWLFGLDLSIERPVFQWNAGSWYLPGLGGQGFLGSFAEGEPHRTVYFGGDGTQWHRSTTYQCQLPPPFPIDATEFVDWSVCT